MKENAYHMKDIVNKYMISRDMIKYYEKKGLVSPERDASGYRIYTEADMQRIKMILDVKNIGLSIDDVESQIPTKGIEEVLKYVEKKLEEKQKEIVELNRQIKKIYGYEEWIMDNTLYKDSFKIGYDYEMCIGCSHMENSAIGNFYVREMQVIHMSEEMTMEMGDEKNVVLTKLAKSLNAECNQCSSGEVIKFPKVYRGAWIKTEHGELEIFLKKIYEKADELGYELSRTLYCLKRFTNKNGKHELLFDIFIPFNEE